MNISLLAQQRNLINKIIFVNVRGNLTTFMYFCVAVILSDYYDLPFNDILNWRRFSIILKEQDVTNLKAVLQSVSDEQYAALHHSLRRVSVVNSHI